MLANTKSGGRKGQKSEAGGVGRKKLKVNKVAANDYAIEHASPIAYLNRMMANAEKTDSAHARWQRYFDPVPELCDNLPVPLLGVMVLIWQLRDQDLQKLFPLDTVAGRMDFIAWCVAHGLREYQSLRDASSLLEALRKPAYPSGAYTPDDPARAISWMMVFIVRARSDLAFDLDTVHGRRQLLFWYMLHGQNEMRYIGRPFESWQLDYLFEPSPVPGFNRMHELAYSSLPNLQKAFPLPNGWQGFLAWLEEYMTLKTRLIDGFCPDIFEVASSAPKSGYADGVNIVGYAFGQLGIGEDARMAAKALAANDVPMTMLNFSPGDNIPQSDRSMEQHVGTELKYATNLYCLTALETGRYFAERGKSCFEGFANIGYWPWELPKWPDEWRHLLALVEEVWVSSKYIADAVRSVASIPVKVMPMAVEIPEVSPLTRKDFRLPEKAKLFLFVFDLNSSAKRKNPSACIRAFEKAFPLMDASGPEVGLVIKVHPPKSPNKEWDALKHLQQNDPRIHLIEQTLSKADLMALYRACDCFLSLHRAEGFGRTIAEAMLLGKPVVTTGFSGNLEFTREDNALLVSHSFRALEKDDYPYGEGQSWAEPDVDHAAAQLLRLIDGKKGIKLTHRLGTEGHDTVARAHNVRTVGKGYAMALAQRKARNV